MLSLVLSTVAFLVARYYINRYLDGMDIPKGLARGLVVFCAAALIAYGIAMIVDWFAP